MKNTDSRLMDSISIPRLSFYEQYLGCKKTEEKIGAYVAYQHLSADFFPVVQMIEVALRNSIDNTIRISRGDYWYNDVPVSEKSQSLVELAKKRSPISGSRDDVICRLPLGFWVYLLDAPYRDTAHSSYIWSPENKELSFSNATNVFGSKLSTKAIFLELREILDLRNRLFHHEPMWKKHNCNSHEKALSNIKKDYLKLRRILRYLSPDKDRLIEITQQKSHINTSCEIDYIRSIIGDVSKIFSNEVHTE